MVVFFWSASMKECRLVWPGLVTTIEKSEAMRSCSTTIRLIKTCKIWKQKLRKTDLWRR